MNQTPPGDESDVGDRSFDFHSTAAFVSGFEADVARLLGPIEPDEDVDVPGLLLVVRCLARIFDSKAAEESYALAPPNLRPQLWLTEPFLKTVESELSTTRARLENLTNLGLVNYNVAELQEQLQALVRRSELSKLDYLPLESREMLKLIVASVAEEVEVHQRRKGLKELEGRAEAAVTKTEAAADVASKAAGKTGGDAMSAFYATLAKNEGKKADNFRWLTVFLALIAAGVALAFVLGHGSSVPWLEIPSDDYVHLAQRAILVAGAFGLAGYFARQAHQHRSMANWAGSLAVQLQTFDAYLAGITDAAVADDLRKSFGTRVFGDHPAMKGEPSVTPSAAAMDTAVGWAAKLTAGGK